MAASEFARQNGYRYLAPDPEVVRRVHDKAFAAGVARDLWDDEAAACAHAWRDLALRRRVREGPGEEVR